MIELTYSCCEGQNWPRNYLEGFHGIGEPGREGIGRISPCRIIQSMKHSDFCRLSSRKTSPGFLILCLPMKQGFGQSQSAIFGLRDHLDERIRNAFGILRWQWKQYIQARQSW